MFVFSMDGLRVVRLDDILPQVDILITATGTCAHTALSCL